MVAPKGYKQSDIGLLPVDWVCLSIDDVLAEISMGPFGSDITVSNFKTSGIPVLNGYNVSSVILNDVIANYVTPDKAKSLKKALAFRGDIVATHRGTIGQISYIPLSAKFDRYVISQSQFRVSINSKKALPHFVVLYFHSRQGQNLLLEKKGHTGVPALAQPTTNFRKLKFPCPPLPEQLAITQALSDADSLITSLEKLIAKKKAIKQGTMQELLTGKKRLPGFGGEWKELNLFENSKLKARIGWQGLTTAEYLSQGDYILITGTDFVNGKIEWSTCCYVEKKRYDQDPHIQIAEGDVLITKDGTIGKVTFVEQLPKPATLNSGVFVVRPLTKSTYSSKFAYHILNSSIFVDFLSKLSAGSTISHLYQKDIGGFSFSAPTTIEEQESIASILADMDAEIEQLEKKLAKYRLIKHGMMQELLTGRIRLVINQGDS